MGIFALVPGGVTLPDAARPEEMLNSLLTAAFQRGGVKFTWLDPWRLDLVMNGRLVSANLNEVVRSWRLAPEARRGEVVRLGSRVLTHSRVVAALKRAESRGVHVQVVTAEKSTTSGSPLRRRRHSSSRGAVAMSISPWARSCSRLKTGGGRSRGWA